MEHPVVSIHNIRQFVFGGNATFTMLNQETGGRLTYNVRSPKRDFGRVWFVSVLAGTNSYTYVGYIDSSKRSFRTTSSSRVERSSKSFKGFNWLLNHIKENEQLPENVNFYHMGKCARCGRALTTPDSIEQGFGPVCAGLN